MTDFLASYIAANSAYKAAAIQLAPLISTVIIVAHHLEHRTESFAFTNTATASPPELAMSRRTSTEDAKTWPSAEALQEAIFNWHDAHSKAVAAWANLSSDAQASMKEPEKPSSSVRYARK
jgi:hypothetical protein